MKVFAIAAWAILGATLSVPAAAAEADVRKTWDAGRCIATRDRAGAAALMRALPLEPGAADLTSLSPAIAQRCARGLNRVDTLQLRGAIAQTLYWRDFGGMGVEPRRSAALINLRLPTQADPAGDPAFERYRWSDCVVRNNGERVDLLLATAPGSRNETRILADMHNYLAACAPPEARISISHTDLRSLIAQSAYQAMYRYWTRTLTSTERR